MSGEVELEKLLAFLEPKLLPEEYAFCSSKSLSLSDVIALNPVSTYVESEGLSLILKKDDAVTAGFEIISLFRCITLTVHSSLNSVGLTAAVANKLAAHSISANVVAAYYHDHVYVPSAKADKAFELLGEFQV